MDQIFSLSTQAGFVLPEQLLPLCALYTPKLEFCEDRIGNLQGCPERVKNLKMNIDPNTAHEPQDRVHLKARTYKFR